jgi:hypothetical protein
MWVFNTKRSFKKEFKRQIKLAIVAAIGFTIAFAWRDAIFNTFQSFVSRVLDVPPEHFLTGIYTSIAITLAGVIVIMITSRIFRD